MKSNELLDNMNLINYKYIMEADSTSRAKKNIWYKYGRVAACLVICLITAFTLIDLNRNKVNNEADNCLTGTKMPEEVNMTVKITSVDMDSFEGEMLDCKLEYFKDKKAIKVKCYDFTNIIEKDGSKFNYDTETPNLEKTSFCQGDVISVSFQSYQYAEGLSYVIVDASYIKLK